MQQYWGMWSDVALVVFALSSLVLAVGSVWLRAKRIAREHSTSTEREIVHRLEQIQQIVEATAIEVERVGDVQRSVVRRLGPQQGLAERPPQRVITPH